MIERLMPVSRAISREPPSRPRDGVGLATVTSRARSRPTIVGSAATRSRASPTGVSAEKIPPFIAPASRMCRTSARVSTPVMAGIPYAASQSSQPRSAPGASSPFIASRMITARACMRSDSIASSLTP